MQNEKTFIINDTALINVNNILRDMGKLHESAVCEISFAAEFIARDICLLLDSGMSINEAISLLSEEIEMRGEVDYIAPDHTALKVASFLKKMSGLNKAIFASLLNEKLKELGYEISEGDYLPISDAIDTFAYVKNSLSDEAYDVFSQEFLDPRIVYADSFRDAAQKVSEGLVGYCILPFEEKGGTRIRSIAELISSLDLKIVAITPVFGFEGDADMKYALVGKNFIIPESNDQTDRYLEIDIIKDDALSLGELISAAEYLSVSVFSVDTFGSNADDDAITYSLVFKDEKRYFTDFLTYLSLFAGDYNPVGFYKNIE